MWIRAETAADHDAIRRVTGAAFAGAEHGSGSEARIVDALRARGELAVSLVADADGAVIGHVAASPVRLDDGTPRWFGLGPVSVAPAQQSRGVGSALVRAALAELARLGAAGCVVLGEPAYYRRFGFRQHTPLHYDDAPAEYFMALSLGDGCPSARVSYSPAFSVA